MFRLYEVFLVIGGLAMILMAAVWPGGLGRRGRSNGARIYSVVLGAAFLGYAFYLLFIFKGGHYFVFYYVFLLPVLLAVRFFRARTAVTAARSAAGQQYPGQQPYTGQYGTGPYTGFGGPSEPGTPSS